MTQQGREAMIASETQGSSVMIDSKEASAALSDINAMVQRVRQSHIYDRASLIAIACGVLVFAGNLANYIAPGYGGVIWITVNLLNVVVVAAMSIVGYPTTGLRTFDFRVLTAFAFFFAFGILATRVLGHFGSRELGVFWPTYFMLFYCLAGLWFGWAFIAIGLSITVLTLIGYFLITGLAFLLWMAVVNGGGLIVSGLWMRWGD
jgi:hypothetical protein